jgi:hypothetical protein
MRLLFSALTVVAPVVALTSPLEAQSRFTTDTDVRSAPTGNVVAMLRSGTSWSTGATRDGYTLVTIVGWVESSRFTAGRDSFPHTIGGDDILRIREEPSLQGRILGEFKPGAGLRIVERRGTWARIRRSVWAPARALATATASAPRPSPGAAAAPSAPATPTSAATLDSSQASPPDTAAPQPRPAGRPGALRAEAVSALRSGPGGTIIGELGSGAIADPIARDRGWVKVRVEGWVAESELVPADTSFGATISAADLRLDPDGMRGRVVRWSVQVVGLQTADPLRKDMAINEPFLLAMGPEGEDAILYITVPPNLVSVARGLAPLARVTLTARIRTGRSEPTGAPILELLSIVSR